MSNFQNAKRYDLEERTETFARKIGQFVMCIPKTMSNLEYCKQLIRSSGSIGANYIEANEALSKKDFLVRIKICRKESKESRYWLNLIDCPDSILNRKDTLLQESTELMKIFGSIVTKSV